MPLLIALIIWLMTVFNPAFAANTHSTPQDRPDSGPVTFHYSDSDFQQVYLTASFTDWVRIPLLKKGDDWVLVYPAPQGRHYYRFAVVEENDVWEAIDPNNPTAINHPDFGWVSVLEIDEADDWEDFSENQSEKKSKKKERRAYEKKIRRELKRAQVLSGELFYQRVDGLSLNLSLHHENTAGTLEPSARLQGSYGFSSGRFGGGLTVLQPIIPSHTLNLKLAIFDRTMANSNSTGIGNLENSLAALFLHEDYFDYHRAKGVNTSLLFKLGDWMRLEGGVRFEEHASLGQPSVWSIKSGDFLPNPVIDDGSLRSLFANLDVGGKYNHLRAEYERSGEEIFGGDFAFERISAQLRGRLKLGDIGGFDARVAVGSNFRGTLPAQKRFLLGGLGTVRGYAYQSLLIRDDSQQSYGGERSVLGNAEYFFQVDDDLGLVLFYDAGMVWQDRQAEPTWDALKTSTGLGLNFGSHDSCRIDIIQRLDDRSRPVVFQFRLKRGF
jgi:hypothetical protein